MSVVDLQMGQQESIGSALHVHSGPTVATATYLDGIPTFLLGKIPKVVLDTRDLPFLRFEVNELKNVRWTAEDHSHFEPQWKLQGLSSRSTPNWLTRHEC